MKENGPITLLPEAEDYDVYDYLELAEEARTKKKKLAYLEKALELAPENVDVQLGIASLTHKTPLEYLAVLDGIIEKEAARLKEAGFFEDAGSFWSITETRPYMRARCERVHVYVSCGMYRLAAEECKEMLTLCEGDNLGMRHMLLHIYAQLEEETAALALFGQYEEESTQMLLPLVVLYYKKRDLEQAAKYLHKLEQCNSGLRTFLRAIKSERTMQQIMEEMDPFGYQFGTVEELITDLLEFSFLFLNLAGFRDWAAGELKRKPKQN